MKWCSTEAAPSAARREMRELVLKVHGLDCAEEVRQLRRELLPLVKDESRLQFDLLNGKLTVDLEEVSADAVLAAVSQTGLRAVRWESHLRQPTMETFWQGRALFTMMSGGMLLIALLWHATVAGWWAALSAGEAEGGAYPHGATAFYAGAILCGAFFFAPKGWYALRALRPDINLLVVIAIAGAVLLGNWFEGALVSFLFSVALLLETWSVGRARHAISSLLELAPARARYRCPCDGDILERPVEDVPLHATVLVRPGERIPLDGRITLGASTVNQAPITGESAPVDKGVGDEVFAGTINNEGAIEFAVTRIAADSTIARIIRMVEEGQSRRAPTEQWVDKFARYYTPAVMLIALGVFLVPPLLWGALWRESFYNALVMLLIACPCALVISTPVSIVAGLACAARNGVLIKGGAYLELPARLKALALDKTGTITTGRPEVRQVTPLNGHSARELLAMAAGIEQHSGHPLAQAIVRHAAAETVPHAEAQEYKEMAGRGAEARIGGERYWIGSHRLLLEKGLGNDTAAVAALTMQEAGQSIVMLGSEEACRAGDTQGHICGVISVADAVRPASAAAMKSLKDAGLTHLVMLTGDNSGTARSVAQAAGLSEFEAELLPEDKVAAVERLRRDYGVVAMVGDGINDAPAMAVADLGIAMGAAGSDAAIESADIALMSDDLSKLPWLVRHSRRTLRVIQQNIWIAVGLKAGVMALAALGLASLWMAVAADMGASLLVIGNALRLLRQGE